MALRVTTILALTALAGLSAACGSTADDKGDTNTNSNDIVTKGAADPCKNGPHTKYLNDDLCIEPPPEEEGFQIHFGPPAGSDYSDPDVLAPFILEPNGEGVLCQTATTPNTEEQYSQEQHIRIRSGTHHIIYWRAVQDANTPPPAAPPDGTVQKDGCRGAGYVFFMGSEAALTEKGGRLDVPLPGATSAYGPEDIGVAQRIQPGTKIWIETHFVNTTENDMLREAWANVVYADKSKITTVMDPIFFIGGVGMNVPPQTTQVVTAGPTKNPLAEEVRIMGIAGHVHAHTTRESVYLNHADGTKDLVYQTFNWAEPLFAQFDAVHKNPVMADGKDGSITGKLLIEPGEGLSWECEVNNTLDGISLRFADRAYDAEMCNVFGYYIPGDGKAWNQVF